jgi:NADH-quinone oxidoreductase subunit N
MALFMLSLAGVPPTAGCVGTLYLFMAAVDAGWLKLAVFGVIYAAIAAYYYLRVIVVMYMREPTDEEVLATPRWTGQLALALLSLGVLVLGVLPASALRAVVDSASVLLR